MGIKPTSFGTLTAKHSKAIRKWPEEIAIILTETIKEVCVPVPENMGWEYVAAVVANKQPLPQEMVLAMMEVFDHAPATNGQTVVLTAEDDLISSYRNLRADIENAAVEVVTPNNDTIHHTPDVACKFTPCVPQDTDPLLLVQLYRNRLLSIMGGAREWTESKSISMVADVSPEVSFTGLDHFNTFSHDGKTVYPLTGNKYRDLRKVFPKILETLGQQARVNEFLENLDSLFIAIGRHEVHQGHSKRLKDCVPK